MPLSAQGAQTVKSILDEVTSEGAKGSPGLVFAAVDKTGKTLIEHASGTRGIDSKEPMDMDTIFWIASMTKIVATIAVLQLVEQGKLSLDDPEDVKKHAPEIGKKKVFADGVTPAEQQKPITMRMLLSHTAGFGYTFFDPRVQGIGEFGGDPKSILDSPLVNQPGTIWEYGVNIDWAGIILERVTGRSLNEYIKEHVLKPLGITSGIDMFPDEAMQKNLAHMHQRHADGSLHEREHLSSNSLKIKTKDEQAKFLNSAGAGLFAKPKEYVKILGALLNNGVSPTTGGRILSEKTVNLMWENQIPDQPNFARGGPPPADLTLANPSPEFYPQEGNPPQGWGLSMFLTIAAGTGAGGTGRGANTGWWAGLANLFWWVDREKGVAGVIASQVLPFGDPKVIPAWFGVEKAIYDNLE